MKKRNSCMPFLAALSLVFASCAKDVIDVTGSIAGTVYDSRTGVVLSGASINITPLGKTVMTGADGKYAFRDIESQTYQVQARKDDYQSDTKSVSVSVGEESVLDFTLHPSAPELALTQQTLDFGNSATTLTLDIRNTGFAPLDWQVSEDIDWLTCTPTSGTTQAGETSSVIVNIDRTHLTGSNIRQSIVISSNGGGATIPVTVAGSELTVSPSSLNFGETTTTLKLSLADRSTGTISYSVKASAPWFTPSKTTGTFSKSEDLSVSVSRDGLEAGDYAGELTIATNGGDVLVVPVAMTVPARHKPTVSITSASANGHYSATVAGRVSDIGTSTISRHGFCWATTSMPTLDLPTACSMGTCDKPTDITYTINNLQPNTKYFVRAYAENKEGVAYSSEYSFTTEALPLLPAVTTGEVSDVGGTTAYVSGNITELGEPGKLTQYGHVWSTSANPTVNLSTRTKLGAKSAKGSYTSTLNNLTENTKYYVRAYATNTNGTSYGESQEFRTGFLESNTNKCSTTSSRYWLSDVTCKRIDENTARVTFRVTNNSIYPLSWINNGNYYSYDWTISDENLNEVTYSSLSSAALRNDLATNSSAIFTLDVKFTEKAKTEAHYLTIYWNASCIYRTRSSYLRVEDEEISNVTFKNVKIE